jgi:hypothetical protein
MPESSQVDRFLDVAKTELAAAPPLDPNAAKVPFPSPLVLTGKQEKKMLDQAFERLKELEQESGRDQTLNPTWWMNLAPAPNLMLASQGLLPSNTFLGKRSRYEATFGNDVSWRPWTMGPDNIFMTSNLVVPLARRICRQQIARAKNKFFGSDPWFSIDPKPEPSTEIDDKMADRIQNFCRFKLKETDSKTDKESAITRALILGECVVKTSYVVRDQFFDCEAMVLTDVTGEPSLGQDGNHITQDDQWDEQPLADQEQQPSMLGKLGAMVKQRTFNPTVKVLRRDGTTQMPDAPIWTKQTLPRRQILFEGARSEPIYYKDFLCPLTATDVQTADCIVHLYDKPVMEFVDLIVKRGQIPGDNASRQAAGQRIAALVQKLSGDSSAPKAAVTMELRPNENFSPIPGSQKAGGPVAEFAEFCLWFDANEDGIAENILLIADRKNQAPIFYDHVPNVTTDGLRPFEVIRINPVEGRWYGYGVMELFESYQVVTDLMVNRWNFSQSRSGRVDLWNPTNTIEGDRDPNLKMNWGGTYTKKPGMKKEDIIETVYLTDTKFEQIHEMIQFFMQLAMNESGVSMANDDQAAGMQSAKLATGIVNVQQSGDELFDPTVSDLRGPFSRLLEREIHVTLANMNPEEAFSYLEGDTLGIDKLTPDDVRGLRFKVNIELTTHKNQQIIQMSAQAEACVKDFYSLPPEIQVKVAPMYRNHLRALSPHTNAEEIISPMVPLPPAGPPAEGGEPGEGAEPGEAPQPAAGGPQARPAGPGGSTPFPTQLSQTNSQPKTAA